MIKKNSTATIYPFKALNDDLMKRGTSGQGGYYEIQKSKLVLYDHSY